MLHILLHGSGLMSEQRGRMDEGEVVNEIWLAIMLEVEILSCSKALNGLGV